LSLFLQFTTILFIGYITINNKLKITFLELSNGARSGGQNEAWLSCDRKVTTNEKLYENIGENMNHTSVSMTIRG
jgi:hypothetical protein